MQNLSFSKVSVQVSGFDVSMREAAKPLLFEGVEGCKALRFRRCQSVKSEDWRKSCTKCSF